MYFLIGLEAGDIFLKRGFNSWPWGTPLTLFFMYCGSQVSIEMKNWEIWKELAKLSDEHTNWFWICILKLRGFFFPCFKCLLIIFRTSGFFRNIFWGWWYILKINNPQCSHNTQVICICYFIFSKSKSIFFYSCIYNILIFRKYKSEFSRVFLIIAQKNKSCLLIYWRLESLTPYLSALDFRILDFGVYFKLGKKSSSKPTWFFFRVWTWFLLPV